MIDRKKLLEKSPFSIDCGQLIGRDPESLSVKEYEQFFPDHPTGLKAIRVNCYSCSGDDWTEVRKCVQTSCVFWPYRMGKKAKTMRESKGEVIGNRGKKGRVDV